MIVIMQNTQESQLKVDATKARKAHADKNKLLPGKDWRP